MATHSRIQPYWHRRVCMLIGLKIKWKKKEKIIFILNWLNAMTVTRASQPTFSITWTLLWQTMSTIRIERIEYENEISISISTYRWQFYVSLMRKHDLIDQNINIKYRYMLEAKWSGLVISVCNAVECHSVCQELQLKLYGKEKKQN